MTIEITERQRTILYNALCNRSELLKETMKIYAREDDDNAVLFCIQERAEIREIKRMLK